MGESYFEKPCEPFIHLATSQDGIITDNKKLIGTYFHGIFHNDALREVVLNEIRIKKGLKPILNRRSFAQIREEGFDLLASEVRKHIKLHQIYQLCEGFGEKTSH